MRRDGSLSRLLLLYLAFTYLESITLLDESRCLYFILTLWCFSGCASMLCFVSALDLGIHDLGYSAGEREGDFRSGAALRPSCFSSLPSPFFGLL